MRPEALARQIEQDRQRGPDPVLRLRHRRHDFFECD